MTHADSYIILRGILIGINFLSNPNGFPKAEYICSLRQEKPPTELTESFRSRLREHDSPNKDRSILRKNIGLALLRENNDPFLEKWKLDLTSREARRKHGPLVDFKRQRVIEEAVTDRIRRTFSFVAFPVEDKDARFELKSRIISTLSLCDGCRPSEQWLGRCSPKNKIRESGLWLTQGLRKEPLSEDEISYLRAMVPRTARGD